MLAPRASISGSWAASNAMSLPKSRSKPASAVRRRRIVSASALIVNPPGLRTTSLRDHGAALGDGRFEPFEERLHRGALQLQGGWVDDEARADRHDVLHRDQVVGLQRIAAAHEIDDDVREARERRELHGPVELDE